MSPLKKLINIIIIPHDDLLMVNVICTNILNMNVEIKDMEVDRDIKYMDIRVVDMDMDLRGVWVFGIWLWTSKMIWRWI